VKRQNREDQELIAIFDWAKHFKILREHMFHIANERKTTFAAGKRLSRKGVMPGVADIFLSYPSGDYHGLYIELKGPKAIKGYRPAKVSKPQMTFLGRMCAAGYCTCIKYGAEEAIEAIEHYLTL